MKRNKAKSILAAVVVAAALPALAGAMPGDLNVRDFGAKGDGVTDDTAAFTAAGLALCRHADAEAEVLGQRNRKQKSGAKDGPRRRLVVPKGRYLVSGPAFFSSDAFVVGEDGAEIVGASPSNDIFYVQAAYRARFENLSFSGGRSHIKVETLNKESANVRVTGCTFRGSSAPAFLSPSLGIDKKGVGEWTFDAQTGRFVRDERYLSPKLSGNNHSSLIVIDNCVFESCAGAIKMNPDGSVVRNCRIAMAPGATAAAVMSKLIHAYGLEITHCAGSAAFEVDGNLNLWFEDSSVTTADGSGARVLRGRVMNPAQVSQVVVADVRTDAGLAKGGAICSFTGGFPANAALVRVTAEGPNKVAAFAFGPEETEEAFDACRRIKTWEVDRFFSYGIRDCGANISAPSGYARRFVREVPDWAAKAGGAKCRMECLRPSGRVVRERLEPKWHAAFRTRELDRNTVIECGGVAALAGVSDDIPWFVVKKGVQAVFRNLQVRGGKSFVVVEDGGEAYVDSCFSYDSAGPVFVCEKGGRLVVDNGVYYSARLYEGEGDAFLRSIWFRFTDVVPSDQELKSGTGVVNRGRLVLWDILGVPTVFSRFEKSFASKPPVAEYEMRWIDNYGDMSTRMFRYGSESGGIVPVYHFGKARTVIEGHYAGYWNRSVPDTPVMCDSPSADARIFCTSFSLYRQHLKRIEMLWQDPSGARRRVPKAKMSFTCPLPEPEDDGSASSAAENETAKWQAEIDRASASGGGVVSVPAGVHRVGGLELRSNVELRLEKGAVLEALYGLENYRVVKLPYSEGDWSAIVMGLNVTNAAVTGDGTIDGRGALWPPTPKGFKGCHEGLRPRGLFFAYSKDVRLEGYTLRNTACWGQVFKNCDGVTARGITVFNHGNQNNDGFDIEAKNVLIENCVLDTNDDQFCIKSNDPGFTVENVTIRNCTARGQASAFKIGTATRGVVRHVRVENLRCEPTRGIFSRYADGTPAKYLYHLGVYHHPETYPYGFGLIGIAVECVDGGCVEDVVVDGVTFVDGFKIPIFVRADRRAHHHADDGLRRGQHNVLRDVVIRNVRGYVIGPTASSITGTKDFRVQNVLLENIDVVQPGAGETAGRLAAEDPAPCRENCYPSPDIYFPGILPAYGLYVDYADGVELKNVRFRTLAEGPVELRPEIVRTGR